MSRHEKGTKHKDAMAKKEKTEMKQAEGQTLGVDDMDLVDNDNVSGGREPQPARPVFGVIVVSRKPLSKTLSGY
jgi:hypothetical protein